MFRCLGRGQSRLSWKRRRSVSLAIGNNHDTVTMHCVRRSRNSSRLGVLIGLNENCFLGVFWGFSPPQNVAKRHGRRMTVPRLIMRIMASCAWLENMAFPLVVCTRGNLGNLMRSLSTTLTFVHLVVLASLTNEV
jgi:hypothetical protein